MSKQLEKVTITITREDGTSQTITTTDFIAVILREEQRVDIGKSGMSGVGVGAHIMVQSPVHAYALTSTLKEIVKQQEDVLEAYKAATGAQFILAGQEHVDSGEDLSVEDAVKRILQRHENSENSDDTDESETPDLSRVDAESLLEMLKHIRGMIQNGDLGNHLRNHGSMDDLELDDE